VPSDVPARHDAGPRGRREAKKDRETLTATPRPSGWWYVLGAGLVVLGPLTVMYVGMVHLERRVAAMPRAEMPSRLALEIGPGEYDLYLEEQSVIDGRTYYSPDYPGLVCKLIHEAEGRILPVTTSSTSTSYRVASYSGRSIGSFRVDDAGVYLVACEVPRPPDAPRGTGGRRFVIAVGADVGRTAIASVAGTFGSMLAGLAMLLVVRSKRKKWFRAHPPPPAPPATPPLPDQPPPRSVPAGV
jgi:hypothetical protein